VEQMSREVFNTAVFVECRAIPVIRVECIEQLEQQAIGDA
jgi:hypothetical protein